MAANRVSHLPLQDTEHQSTGQLSRDEESTARNSWNNEYSQDEARQNGEQQGSERPPQPVNNRKTNDNTNLNLGGAYDNNNSDGRSYNNNNNQAQTQSSEEDADHQPWFRRVAEKYGTLELENKGSVARDHLALGISASYTMTRGPMTNRHRTHVPRLVANIPLICVHRHCSNSVIPSQQLRILQPTETSL